MKPRSRREFLAQVGKGMLVASVGPALASDLGLVRLGADQGSERLSFGTLDPLVALMQETAPAKLIPLLVAKLQDGTDLRTLVAAGAFANARTFGGQDYVGFHTFMALAPAYEMARELPTERQPLPVLKVLYRNANRIQEFGGRRHEVLHPVAATALPEGHNGGELLREATRGRNVQKAEQTFAALAQGPAGEAFNHLQYSVQDEVDVHRVVLAWRAWMILDLAGMEQAHTMLRQSVRYCTTREPKEGHRSPIRTLLPKLFDRYGLLSRPLGTRRPDDAWIEQMGQCIYADDPARAADAVAAALAEGMA